MTCNRDCFHCRFADCALPDYMPMTQWERKALKGALGGWEHEAQDNAVQKMQNDGYTRPEIMAKLCISLREYDASMHRLWKHKKKAALLLAQEKRQNTLTTKSITA